MVFRSKTIAYFQNHQGCISGRIWLGPDPTLEKTTGSDLFSTFTFFFGYKVNLIVLYAQELVTFHSNLLNKILLLLGHIYSNIFWIDQSMVTDPGWSWPRSGYDLQEKKRKKIIFAMPCCSQKLKWSRLIRIELFRF